MDRYCVYILTNVNNTVVYAGCTNDLARRLYEHATSIGSKFVKKYKLNKLVYVEYVETAYQMITAEKCIKGWTRSKKDTLINKQNPEWKDLRD